MDKNILPSHHYERLKRIRDPYIRRAEDAAGVTIPSLLPKEGHKSTEAFITPFQSIGAKGVSNLASKLSMILIPPNAPFFRLKLDEFELSQMEGGDETTRGEVEILLSEVEKIVQSEIEVSALRSIIPFALKQLVVAGNVLMYVPKEGDVRVFRLDRYVVDRDPMGNPVRIVTKEDIALANLSPEIQEALMEKSNGDSHKEFTLYTMGSLSADGKKWIMTQEVEGIIIQESGHTIPKDKFPYLPLRWTKVDGEDYGPGFVEEILGDLLSLDRMAQVMYEGAAAASKLIWCIAPNSTIKPRDIARAPNGGFIVGRAQDVQPLQANKFADFGVVERYMEKLTNALSLSFLLNSSVQRNAERVTAAEIRFMAQELEDSLGGVYSVLTQELQIPLVNALMNRLQSQGKMPSLPKNLVKPAIVTGLDALGRGHDQSKLEQWFASIAQAFGPTAIGMINMPEYLKRSAANIGVDVDGMIKSAEQIQAEAQQAQQQQMLQQSLPNIINKGGDLFQGELQQQPQEE